ncbi:uncharacterized protein LOC131173011 [Hevea brasiliensis]|uniref:uncharacterized protein LOC131173011 n=1 Tax=Hevea brasiliensis TaxID=3981 RepID=UPI0025F6ED4F|nr:uncharacterized protein LOC131173011 [Hevea brasiliensis]
MANENKVSLQLLIDRKANKVLFAEDGKDFVDFLFTLLSLTVGTVIRLLKQPAMVGCIGNLYESLENLNKAYMQPYQSKDSLLKPTVLLTQLANVPLLLPDTDHLQPEARRKGYGCSYCYHNRCVTDQRVSPMSMISGVALLNKFSVKGFCGLNEKMVEFGIDEGLELLKASLQSKAALTNVFLAKNEIKDKCS